MKRENVLQKAWQAVAEGRSEEAEGLFRSLLERDGQDAEAWHGLGVSLYQQGAREEAYEALRRSVALAGDRMEAWHALAQAADARGYTLEALEAAQEALRLARVQGYPPALVRGLEATVRGLQQGVARLLHAFGLGEDSPEARERLRQAFDAYRRGVDALRAGRVREAVDALQESLQHAPQNPRAWSNLGVAHMMAGRRDDAEAAFRRALELDPTYEPARFNLEKLLQGEGEAAPLLHGFTQVKRDAPKRDTLK